MKIKKSVREKTKQAYLRILETKTMECFKNKMSSTGLRGRNLENDY
jgi:hypothetical protein